MTPKTYRASSLREALAMVKQELGDQALVLSSNEVRRGLRTMIEISAVADSVAAGAATKTPAANPRAQAPEERELERLIAPLRSELRALRSLLRAKERETNPPPLASRAGIDPEGGRSARRVDSAGAAPAAAGTAPRIVVPPPPGWTGGPVSPAEAGIDPEGSRSSRRVDSAGAVVPPRAGIEPDGGRSSRRVDSAGATDLGSHRRRAYRRADSDATAVGPVPSALAPAMSIDDERIDLEFDDGPILAAPSRARVVALVGATGVGKTTTIAKLAARAALMQHLRVAIVTLDDYRVGGLEQIQTYAELIGVPAHLARSADELASVMQELDGMDHVYIDTAGRSPRDAKALAELGATLAAAGKRETHLVVPATASSSQFDSVVARYRAAFTIDRLLVSKLDEADDLGELIAAPQRLALPIAHLTTGQQVPEDLEDATAARLAALASRRARSEAA